MSKHHYYEIEPRGEQRHGVMLKVQGGEVGAEMAARELLREDPDVVSVGIYHSWPSPGPLRRFVKEVKRTDEMAGSLEE